MLFLLVDGRATMRGDPQSWTRLWVPYVTAFESGTGNQWRIRSPPVITSGQNIFLWVAVDVVLGIIWLVTSEGVAIAPPADVP
jgi:hypothetical protein